MISSKQKIGEIPQKGAQLLCQQSSPPPRPPIHILILKSNLATWGIGHFKLFKNYLVSDIPKVQISTTPK